MNNYEFREKGKTNKFDFKKRKDNTIKSLNDVEKFLQGFKKAINSVTLFKILK